MSEQSAPPPGEFGPWLSGQGADGYALVWVDPPSQPAGGTGVVESEPPRLGETGIARLGFDPARRLTVQEVTYGREEALRRWLDLDTGARPLAIVTTGPDGLREHTPGELAGARLLHQADDPWLTRQLAGWLHRRSTTAPQGADAGWSTATAAWTCHMRALSDYPPPSVVSLALSAAGQDATTAELIAATGQNVTALLDRLENPYRSHGELVDDWHTLQALAADVPAYTGTADWLLDQIALRDASAQRLRAVLEPDITDHLHQAPSPHTPAPALDEQRAAHLAQAHATVRAYTAASYSGRPQEARRIRDAFPAPARALTASGPAIAWRRASTTAQRTVEALTEQRAATLDDDADYFADPRLLHARIAYLSARHGQLHALHDALGRLALPTEPPATLPAAVVPIAAAQTGRRLIEAFGTLDRAAQALDGQITYQRQHGPDAPGTEADLLTTASTALDRLTTAVVPLDENEVRARLKQAGTPRPSARPRTDQPRPYCPRGARRPPRPPGPRSGRRPRHRWNLPVAGTHLRQWWRRAGSGPASVGVLAREARALRFEMMGRCLFAISIRPAGPRSSTAPTPRSAAWCE
ncbi:hypothetical protein [Streptomyces solaniscabiei]|uniref:hypothetical protein n=1 Tax=Streptomyces solaniscabiei TaxID=2683255 RepID=UPI001CE30E09|nr:hypothetical protein [Streptomyces solaniscabiei]